MVCSVLSFLRISRINPTLGWGGGGGQQMTFCVPLSPAEAVGTSSLPVASPQALPQCQVPLPLWAELWSFQQGPGGAVQEVACQRPGRQEEQALRSATLLQLGCGRQQAVGCLAIPLAAGPWIHACPPGLHLRNHDFWALF